MKTIGSLTAMLFAAVLSVSAQTSTPQTGIGVIDSGAFLDEKAGITKYVNAVKAVNAEFAPKQNEIQQMSNRLQTLGKELEDLRGRINSGLIKPNDAGYIGKADEADKLQRDIKFKSEDAKVAYEKKMTAVTTPVIDAIGKALTDFAKQRGYALVFDLAKDDRGLVILLDDKTDITAEFIKHFNALP